MKHRLTAVLIAVLMVGSMSTAAYALTSDDSKTPGSHGKSGAHHAAKPSTDDETEESDGNGPPPWARGHQGKPDQAWKKAWKAMTPAERAAKMAELAQKHADGMKKFAACVKSAGDDSTARGRCVRPLPPGLAKKLVSN